MTNYEFLTLQLLGQIASGVSLMAIRPNMASADAQHRHAEQVTEWQEVLVSVLGRISELAKEGPTETPAAGTPRVGLLARFRRVADDSPVMLNLAEIKSIKPDGPDRCLVTMRDGDVFSVTGEFEDVSRQIQNLQATGNY